MNASFALLPLAALPFALGTPRLAPVPIPASVRAVPSDVDAYMPAPSAALELAVAGDEVLGLMEILRAYEKVSPVTFVMNQETRQFVESTGAGFVTTPELTLELIPTFVQCVLRSNDFILVPASQPDIGLLEVISLRTQARNTVRAKALVVEAEQVETMRRNPAFIMTTVLDLPNTDVRQLSNSMRTMITDANTQQMLPAGNTNQMVVTAFGDYLAEMVGQLKSIDAASAVPPARLLAHELQHVDVREVTVMLNQLFSSPPPPVQGQPQGAVSFQHLRWTGDTRTNTIFVHGTPGRLQAVTELIARVDVEVK